MSRELTPRITKYAKARVAPPASPQANQRPSPAIGFLVVSFGETFRPPSFDGPALWAEIHRRALVTLGDDSEFIAGLAARLPCNTCRPHWLTFLRRFPPVWGAGYFAWTVKAHNDVNLRLGKYPLTEAQARAIWEAKPPA